jgi:hypothetical protein
VPENPRKQRRADLRLLLGATIGVLLGGVIIAAAILAVTSRAGTPSIKHPISFGLAENVRKIVRDGGPVNITGPDGSGAWIAIEHGRLVALLVKQPAPQSCTLRWRGSKNSFTCDGRRVSTTQMARFRSFTAGSGPTKGLLMVALRDVEPGPGG